MRTMACAIHEKSGFNVNVVQVPSLASGLLPPMFAEGRGGSGSAQEAFLPNFHASGGAASPLNQR